MRQERKVKAFYTVKLTLRGGFQMTEEFAMEVVRRLFRIPHDRVIRDAIDYVYEYELYASFRSTFTHFEVIENATTLEFEHSEIDSIEIEYQFPYDIAPGRAVIRHGFAETYTAKIEWNM